MNKIFQYVRSHPLSLLLLALPLVALGEWVFHWSPVAIFILAAVGVIPLASYIGEATEALASYTSPRIGALLNATLGNAAELIITIVAVQAGLLELVKASITGSILGNLLLVMGLSMIYGGAKHGIQTFNRRQASRNAILLVLAVVAMLIPSLVSHSIGPDSDPKVEVLSIGVAAIMIVLYALGLLDANKSSSKGGSETSPYVHTLPENSLPHWSIKQSVSVLAASTLAIVWLSETLVGAAEAAMTGLGISEFFLGIILIPVIGNVAEHLVVVQMAGKNKMDLSVEIAVSSSLQIALFVGPLLVFISLILGHPLQLIFNLFELLALGMGVIVAALVSGDGESTWLEGAGLLAVYLILALAFFLLP